MQLPIQLIQWQTSSSRRPLVPLQTAVHDILDILACMDLATHCVDTTLLLVDSSAKEPHHMVGSAVSVSRLVELIEFCVCLWAS